MSIFIYFSLYIIIAGFLYYLKIINYNPFSWLIIALSSTIITGLYIIYYHSHYHSHSHDLIKYIILNTPKLLLLLIIDHKNIFKGFIFYSSLFIIYLILINFDLYNIYYTNTTLKIINNTFYLSLF
jgi:hypothetical protein